MRPIRVGISGWTYAEWRGDFYPRGLRQKDELAYAAERMTSIEVNGSFYSLQRPSSYSAWHDATPDDFVFAVKGGRFITHMKRLRDVETPLANFFASGVLALRDKLGPVLWQLPERVAVRRRRRRVVLRPPPPHHHRGGRAGRAARRQGGRGPGTHHGARRPAAAARAGVPAPQLLRARGPAT